MHPVTPLVKPPQLSDTLSIRPVKIYILLRMLSMNFFLDPLLRFRDEFLLWCLILFVSRNSSSELINFLFEAPRISFVTSHASLCTNIVNAVIVTFKKCGLVHPWFLPVNFPFSSCRLLLKSFPHDSYSFPKVCWFLRQISLNLSRTAEYPSNSMDESLLWILPLNVRWKTSH